MRLKTLDHDSRLNRLFGLALILVALICMLAVGYSIRQVVRTRLPEVLPGAAPARGSTGYGHTAPRVARAPGNDLCPWCDGYRYECVRCA